MVHETVVMTVKTLLTVVAVALCSVFLTVEAIEGDPLAAPAIPIEDLLVPKVVHVAYSHEHVRDVRKLDHEDGDDADDIDSDDVDDIDGEDDEGTVIIEEEQLLQPSDEESDRVWAYFVARYNYLRTQCKPRALNPVNKDFMTYEIFYVADDWGNKEYYIQSSSFIGDDILANVTVSSYNGLGLSGVSPPVCEALIGMGGARNLPVTEEYITMAKHLVDDINSHRGDECEGELSNLVLEEVLAVQEQIVAGVEEQFYVKFEGIPVPQEIVDWKHLNGEEEALAVDGLCQLGRTEEYCSTDFPLVIDCHSDEYQVGEEGTFVVVSHNENGEHIRILEKNGMFVHVEYLVGGRQAWIQQATYHQCERDDTVPRKRCQPISQATVDSLSEFEMCGEPREVFVQGRALNQDDFDVYLYKYSWQFTGLPHGSRKPSILGAHSNQISFFPDATGKYDIEFSVFDGCAWTKEATSIVISCTEEGQTFGTIKGRACEHAPVPTWVGDGLCDTINNFPGCWDGGDCCESTCRSGAYTCGSGGFSCDKNSLAHKAPASLSARTTHRGPHVMETAVEHDSNSIFFEKSFASVQDYGFLAVGGAAFIMLATVATVVVRRRLSGSN